MFPTRCGLAAGVAVVCVLLACSTKQTAEPSPGTLASPAVAASAAPAPTVATRAKHPIGAWKGAISTKQKRDRHVVEEPMEVVLSLAADKTFWQMEDDGTLREGQWSYRTSELTLTVTKETSHGSGTYSVDENPVKVVFRSKPRVGGQWRLEEKDVEEGYLVVTTLEPVEQDVAVAQREAWTMRAKSGVVEVPVAAQAPSAIGAANPAPPSGDALSAVAIRPAQSGACAEPYQLTDKVCVHQLVKQQGASASLREALDQYARGVIPPTVGQLLAGTTAGAAPTAANLPALPVSPTALEVAEPPAPTGANASSAPLIGALTHARLVGRYLGSFGAETVLAADGSFSRHVDTDLVKVDISGRWELSGNLLTLRITQPAKHANVMRYTIVGFTPKQLTVSFVAKDGPLEEEWTRRP